MQKVKMCKIFSGSMEKIESEYQSFLIKSHIDIISTTLCQDFNNIQSRHGTDNSFYFVVTYLDFYTLAIKRESELQNSEVTGIANTISGEQFEEKISSYSKEDYEQMTMLKRWFRWFTGK